MDNEAESPRRSPLFEQQRQQGASQVVGDVAGYDVDLGQSELEHVTLDDLDRRKRSGHLAEHSRQPRVDLHSDDPPCPLSQRHGQGARA